MDLAIVDLLLEEAKHVYQRGTEHRMVGTGQSGLVELCEEAAEHFRRKTCRVELLPTRQAIEAWDEAEGAVHSLFHVTCWALRYRPDFAPATQLLAGLE